MSTFYKWAARTVSSIRERITRRLVNKLILLFTSIIILVVVSLTVISYQMLEREAVNSSISSARNNLLLVGRNLENYLGEIEQLSLPQIRYDEIIGAIASEDRDYASRMYLENYLRSLYFSRNDVEAITLYLVDRQKVYALTREAYNVTVRVRSDPSVADRPWYKETLASDRNRTFQSLLGTEGGMRPDEGSAAEGNSFMAYHRVLRSLASRKPQAVITFYMMPTAKDQILKDVPLGKGEHLLYLDPNDVPFHYDDPAFYRSVKEAGLLDKLREEQSDRFAWSNGEQRYLVVTSTGEREGWKLVKLIPYSKIYEAAKKARNLSYLIGLAFLVLSVVLVTLTSNAITKPIKNLSHQMRRFSAGFFDAEAEVRGRDEIAYLTRHFNQMVKRTNDLINERYKSKLVEKNAILKALEAEINPHFLYNALQAISTKALKNERYDIADMVDALALTLRYCISGKDIVQAREELGHIERYLALQKARFGSRLQVKYEWDESLKELQIPKLSIQSLVENSIKHALEKVSSTITIVIGAGLNPTHAVISVRDDGPGIPPDRLGEILRSLETKWEERETENIGLVNLHTRLKLLYGDEAGLVIRSDEGGTEMSMWIPRGGNVHV
ncbi:MAG: two-component sensor histidine kinase [Cohnella sp.]|uniref:cache domain-containing sensor histidine kinase n=1 Tax=Cohnella sp. TaxID=1883426 RepID=UPI000E39D44C|nr:histidine kinase [Cohnella sp.]REK65751.1 MAG: two-component sensor histidine kinase [Cohnella sp.]